MEQTNNQTQQNPVEIENLPLPAYFGAISLSVEMELINSNTPFGVIPTFTESDDRNVVCFENIKLPDVVHEVDNTVQVTVNFVEQKIDTNSVAYTEEILMKINGIVMTMFFHSTDKRVYDRAYSLATSERSETPTLEKSLPSAFG